MVIEARSVVKRYGDAVALKGVDLRIEGAGIFGLLGPNGAGKTTLAEILEGLRLPTSGEVRVAGMDPAADPHGLRERMGVQLQSTSLPSDLQVGEVVRLFRSFYPRTLAAPELLERVRLGDRSRVRVRDLSGGERQRLALALAMVHDPEILVLDEPTSGLDPEARRAIHEILRELRARGRTVLVTSHYLDEIEALADRVMILRRGALVAEGTPLELVARSSGLSTLWVATDGALDPAPFLAAGAEPRGRDGRHERFVTKDPAAAVLALGEILRAQRLALQDLRMKRPTLEDVYLELVDEQARSRAWGSIPLPQRGEG
jgi:ABC-2 type transport system ATP-binding protein